MPEPHRSTMNLLARLKQNNAQIVLITIFLANILATLFFGGATC
ncbi:MAG: hypothetical protein ABSE95_08050 [Thermodesulfobacteriota bacterium]